MKAGCQDKDKDNKWTRFNEEMRKGKHRFQEYLTEAANRRGIKHDALSRKKRRKRSNQLASVSLPHPTRRFSNGRTLMSRLHLETEHRLITGWESRLGAFRLHVGSRLYKMSGGDAAGRPPTLEVSRPYSNELAAHPRSVWI